MLKLDPMLLGKGVSDSPGDVQGGVHWEYLGCPLPGLYSMYWHLHSTWRYMTYLGKSSQNYPGGRGAFRHFFVHHCVHQCWQISCLSFLVVSCDCILVLSVQLLSLTWNITCWSLQLCHITCIWVIHVEPTAKLWEYCSWHIWPIYFIVVFYRLYIFRCFNLETLSTLGFTWPFGLL